MISVQLSGPIVSLECQDKCRFVPAPGLCEKSCACREYCYEGLVDVIPDCLARTGNLHVCQFEFDQRFSGCVNLCEMGQDMTDAFVTGAGMGTAAKVALAAVGTAALVGAIIIFFV
jgi:hypothetical protein